MELPLYIRGEESGIVRITKEGLYTVLETELRGGGAELVRLWAHGGGRSAYLGVMQPLNGGLLLRRKLSRRELAALPDPIERVSDRERETEKEGEPPAAEQPESAVRPPETGTDHRACPWPAEPPEEGLLWYSRPDGSLVSFDGISSLVAFPAELRAPKGRGLERVIEGKKYLVFRY